MTMGSLQQWNFLVYYWHTWSVIRFDSLLSALLRTASTPLWWRLSVLLLLLILVLLLLLLLLVLPQVLQYIRYTCSGVKLMVCTNAHTHTHTQTPKHTSTRMVNEKDSSMVLRLAVARLAEKLHANEQLAIHFLAKNMYVSTMAE